MTSQTLLFFVHLATGALFSLIFVLCGKIKKTYITLFFVDFSLTLIAGGFLSAARFLRLRNGNPARAVRFFRGTYSSSPVFRQESRILVSLLIQIKTNVCAAFTKSPRTFVFLSIIFYSDRLFLRFTHTMTIDAVIPPITDKTSNDSAIISPQKITCVFPVPPYGAYFGFSAEQSVNSSSPSGSPSKLAE